MSFASLEITRNATGKESINFDVVMREGHDSVTSITQHPVELGADITDHIRVNLDRFSCEGFVTNTPIVSPPTQMEGITGRVSGVELDVPAPPLHLPIGIPIIGALGLSGPQPQIKANVLNFSGQVGRTINVYNALLEIQSTGELVSIITLLRTYENMAIEHLGAPREAGGGQSITFTVDFVEVRTVQTKTVTAPKDRNAKKKTNRGVQTTKPDEKPEDKRSFFHKLKHGGA